MSNRETLKELEDLLFKYADESQVKDEVIDDILYYVEQFATYLDIEVKLQVHSLDIERKSVIFSLWGSVTENVAESYHFQIEMRGVHNHDFVQVMKRTHLRYQDGSLSVSPVKTRYGRVKLVNNPLRFLRSLQDHEIQLLGKEDYKFLNSKH